MMADLRSYCLADSTVSSLIGTRFHLDRIPQNQTLPNVRYSILAESVTNTHGADTAHLNDDAIRIEVFSKKASDGLAIKDALKSRLNSKRVTQGTTVFQLIEWSTSQSDYDDDFELFRQIITINVMWSPT